MRSRPRGAAVITTLLVLALVAVIAVAVAGVGIHHLNLVNADVLSRQAMYAAAAGVHTAVRELRQDSGWSDGFQSVAFGSWAGARYSVAVFNNFAGSSSLTASNGVQVPAGTTYLLATGTTRGGKYPRQVGVILRLATWKNYRYAVASGSSLTFQASTKIVGSLKCNGDINFSAAATVDPKDGEGRVLSSANVNNATNLTLDPSQDVRARSSIANPSKVKGTTLVFEGDTTEDTEPFIADGRTTNTTGAGETGEVLPNPDPAKLLAPGEHVDHGSTTTVTTAFDLGGAIHYFPQGVTFKPGSTITGEGTIVVGNGNSAVFEIPLGSGSDYLKMNVVAIDGSNGTVGGNSIVFKAATKLHGLVYSHDDITTEASFKLRGTMIAYKPGGGDVVHTGASMEVTAEPLAVPVPGFEPWGLGATDVMQVLSWQRI